MTDPNVQYAYFTITGDFEPVDVSTSAGVTPTECWVKGDLNPHTQMERKFSRWSLYSRLDRSRSIEAHIEDVIEQLAVNRGGFVELSSKYGGTMQLVAYFHADYPGVHFDRSLVESLSEFRLSVDFDFYYLYSDVREDS